jgi:hypothetical protein
VEAWFLFTLGAERKETRVYITEPRITLPAEVLEKDGYKEKHGMQVLFASFSCSFLGVSVLIAQEKALSSLSGLDSFN